MIHTENTKSVVSGFILTEVLLIRHWVRELVLSERYRLMNTYSVVSWLILTEVLLIRHWVREPAVSVRYTLRIIHRALYLDWYRLKYYWSDIEIKSKFYLNDTDWRIHRASYLDWYRRKFYCRTLSLRESCIWTIQPNKYILCCTGLIHWVLERVESIWHTLRIHIALYLDWYRPKNYWSDIEF